MKFYSFDETTYPGIPDEVGPETHQTNKFCDPQLAVLTYQEHLEEWELCEELGFDGAFVNEHHFTYFNINPSCTVLAAALIARTKRMKVGGIAQYTDVNSRQMLSSQPYVAASAFEVMPDSVVWT